MNFRPVRVLLAANLLLLAAASSAVERVLVDHAHVTSLAQALASRPYVDAAATAPDFFRGLNYDTYRKIAFRPEKSLWRETGLRFQLQFFHPGYLFNRMVRLNEFTATHSQAIPFSPDFFDYRDLDVPLLSRRGLDFAGFRLVHPLNRQETWDEVISFLGANHYRGLGRNHAYGASSRGLALHTGTPAEEFPNFTEYWVRKPDPDANTITVHALLDGPSVSGAYTFVITPGDETVVDTRATLFFRQEADMPGFVPVSSMFWFGEESPTRFGDFRPEVHDSDGLLVAPDPTSRIWRPLRNPPAISYSDFDTPQFAGFGLLQRDRDYRSYEDMVASYERRPGVWMEPVGAWPPGRVRLVEAPATNEHHDNITAYWSPKEKIPPGHPFELSWKQRWTSAPTFGGPPGWVSATRHTLHDGAPDRTKYVIDYDVGSLAHLPAEASVTADVSVTGIAQVQHAQVFRNMANGARRLVIVLSAPVGSLAVDVRARLMLDQQPISETWTMPWQP